MMNLLPRKVFLHLVILVCPFYFQLTVAEDQPMRTISVDYSGPSHPLNDMPTLCVGAGRANEGLRADWQQQLAQTQRDCGFRYLRFHGLLCDDMGVYLVDQAGVAHYNWQYIDALFDAMLEMHIRPFVELGFMPSGLASGPDTIFWWKGNVTPPEDPLKWEALIQALVTHWTERYGEEEVAQWYFEVWNEPNLSGFWIGDKKGLSDEAFGVHARDEYFKLYEVTARAVKSVSSHYRVGGPATAGNAWIPETIDFCVQNDVPLDFISTHHYAVLSGFLDEMGNTGTILSPDRKAIIKEVKHSRSQIQESALPNLGLHYTEWSTSYTPSDPVHDSYHSAAFILNKVKGVEESAQSMSYWTFTDIFEEAGPRATPFHGGFGLTNYQGIHKASYFAYKFFNQLGPVELENNDVDSWVCKDDKGSLQALFWDFTITHPGGEVNNQDYYNQDLPPLPASAVNLNVANMAPGEYKLTLYEVGYRNNDAYTAYLDMDAPDQLTREQVAALKSKSKGEPSLQDTVTVGSNGVLDGTFPMRQNDVVLVIYERL